jgi:parvulin-like peptidyl-prolyl isomerase
MAKKAKKRASKELTRKQRSRLERERRIERLLVSGVIVVGVLVVGVVTYGFVVERVLKAREAVAVVDGTPIATADFQSRVRFARLQRQTELQYWRQQQQALDPTDAEVQPFLEYIQGNIRELQGQLSPAGVLSIGEQVLDQLIQEELVRQEAERRGITVAPEELQQEIEQFFGYERNPATPTPEPAVTFPLTPTGVLTSAPTSTPLPTPTPLTEQAFRERYDDYLGSLKSQGISEKQYRSWVEASLLAERLQEQLKAEVSPTADQVKLRYFVVDSEERANELAARLDAGEDFQVLIDELEEDEDFSGYGTELDWLPRNVLELRLDADLADLAFELEVGEHSQPVASEDGSRYTVIQVEGHEERELDEVMRGSLGEAAFQEWLDAQQVLVERKAYEDRVPTEP